MRLIRETGQIGEDLWPGQAEVSENHPATRRTCPGAEPRRGKDPARQRPPNFRRRQKRKAIARRACSRNACRQLPARWKKRALQIWFHTHGIRTQRSACFHLFLAIYPTSAAIFKSGTC